HEAVANRSMLDLHRPLERGLLKEGSEKDVEAVRELLKHLLRLVGVSSNGRTDASNVRAVVGVPAASLRTNKQYLRNSMKGIVDSLMIVSEPFAVAYGLNALLHTMIIDIGAGTTDFCVMKGRYPTEEDQRTLTVAGDSIDAQLLKLIEERYPQANVTVFMVRDWKEKFSFVGSAPEKIVVTAPVKGVPTDLDITNEMKAACETLVGPGGGGDGGGGGAGDEGGGGGEALARRWGRWPRRGGGVPANRAEEGRTPSSARRGDSRDSAAGCPPIGPRRGGRPRPPVA